MRSKLQNDGDIGVLVPNELGERTVSAVAGMRAVRYELGAAPTDTQRAARVLVVEYPPLEPTLELIRQLPELDYLQVLSAGYEQWLGRLPDGVMLANVSGVHGIGVAEWVVAVLLAHYRDLSDFAAAQRAGTWRRHPTDSLLGKRVTVLGAGDIGARTRDLLTPFGCRVRLVGTQARSGVVALEDYLTDAGADDVVVIALPLTRTTTGMVDAAFLRRLRDGSVVVNAGRGAIVDSDALAAEAVSGRLYGILDVVEPEPLPDHHPLWSTPGITITPHVAGSIPGVWDRAWVAAVDDLRDYAEGRAPRDLVATA